MASPIENMDPAFAAQFLKIQKIFIAGLPKRMADILHAVDAHSQHVALHQLAGAAGGYGFSALSVLAREAMDAQESETTKHLHDALQRLTLAVSDILREH